jgi:hypothetical protein
MTKRSAIACGWDRLLGNKRTGAGEGTSSGGSHSEIIDARALDFAAGKQVAHRIGKDVLERYTATDCVEEFLRCFHSGLRANPRDGAGRALFANAAHRAARTRVSAHAGDDPFREIQDPRGSARRPRAARRRLPRAVAAEGAERGSMRGQGPKTPVPLLKAGALPQSPRGVTNPWRPPFQSAS